MIQLRKTLESSDFYSIDERICTMGIKAKMLNKTLICVNAPTEVVNEKEKEALLRAIGKIRNLANTISK